MTHEQFLALAKKWTRQVGHLSSIGAAVKHAACREILDAGPIVVPWILAEVKARRGLPYWFGVLSILTNDSPIPKEHRGIVLKMAEDWVAWGEQRGLV